MVRYGKQPGGMFPLFSDSPFYDKVLRALNKTLRHWSGFFARRGSQAESTTQYSLAGSQTASVSTQRFILLGTFKKYKKHQLPT